MEHPEIYADYPGLRATIRMRYYDSMKKPARKLVIRKETLVALAHTELVQVIGGVVNNVQILSDAKECPVRNVITTASGGA